MPATRVNTGSYPGNRIGGRARLTAEGGATPTRKVIARRADVSVATVSAVLNKNRYVSPLLAARVQRVVDELGYRPNAIARSLSNQATLTIAVVIPNILSPFWPTVVKAAEDRAASSGYRILLQNTNEDRERERLALDLLDERRVDGAIWAPVGGDANRAYVLHLLARGANLVMVDRTMDGVPIDAVVTDNRGLARAATQHLIDHGRRRIAFIGPPESVSCAAERLMGYRDAVQEAGLRDSRELVGTGGHDEEWAYASVRRLLAAVPDLDGLVGGAHLLTLGALRALADAGVQVPDHVAVVGYDDFPWAPCLSPPLTVVAQPQADMGRTAVELLLRRIASRRSDGDTAPLPPERRVLGCRLVLRRSCGCDPGSP
jgi:LacI family transcriptional regulator